MLTGPAQAGEEREKSITMRSPSMVRSSAIFSGSSTMPSLSRKSSAETVARGQLGDLGPHQAAPRGCLQLHQGLGDGGVAIFVQQLAAMRFWRRGPGR